MAVLEETKNDLCKWEVFVSQKVTKAIKQLPGGVKKSLIALIKEIENNGPVRGNWKNYGKLSDTKHHCHLKTGRPTYVAVWEIDSNKIKIVEVIYAGTHEKAPY
jgi:mRNA-degrading endonuclease RelE of RelBE toxin-antitoxin system